MGVIILVKILSRLLSRTMRDLILLTISLHRKYEIILSSFYLGEKTHCEKKGGNQVS